MKSLMRNIFLCIFLLIVLYWHVPNVLAQNPACESDLCVEKECSYLEDQYCVNPNDPYGGQYVCGTIWVTKLCCTIPQSGGGQCTCCSDDGGCYLNCPAPPPGGSYSYSQGSYGGATPTPTPIPGTVRMRAVSVASGTSTCAQVNSSTSYIASAITLFPPGATNTTPTDGTYATWTNQPVTPPFTTYSFSDAPPANFILKMACWSRDVPAAAASGYSADLYSGSTITWHLAYTNGTAWAQARGGDVYASATLRSYVPVATSPRYFDLSPTIGTPGVVSYGANYDFDVSSGGSGASFVSSPGWLVNETYAATDFYAVMYHRFGSPAADFTGTTTLTDKLASRAEPYFVDGDLAITTRNWSVTDGENIVVLVDGNLTINRRITLTGTGFVSFIVNGDITIDPSVGASYSSSNPAIEGIYITSPTGTFHTGTSSNAGTERFVGEGIFVAGDFDLQRDLDSIGQNATSSELFIYNPQLLITMPDEMRDLPISWSEVAP